MSMAEVRFITPECVASGMRANCEYGAKFRIAPPVNEHLN